MTFRGPESKKVTFRVPGSKKVTFRGLGVEKGSFRGSGWHFSRKNRVSPEPTGERKCVPVFSHTASSPEGEGISKTVVFSTVFGHFPEKVTISGPGVEKSDFSGPGVEKSDFSGSGGRKRPFFGVWRGRKGSLFGVRNMKY